jgi:hypothetical protein
VLLTHPNEEIVNGKPLPIERYFTRCEHTLPQLGLIHQIQPFRDGQWRIEEEFLQWAPPWRQTTFGIDTTRIAISAAARHRVSFGKIWIKHRYFLLIFNSVVEP